MFLRSLLKNATRMPGIGVIKKVSESSHKMGGVIQRTDRPDSSQLLDTRTHELMIPQPRSVLPRSVPGLFTINHLTSLNAKLLCSYQEKLNKEFELFTAMLLSSTSELNAATCKNNLSYLSRELKKVNKRLEEVQASKSSKEEITCSEDEIVKRYR
jgi:hypothetical protein